MTTDDERLSCYDCGTTIDPEKDEFQEYDGNPVCQDCIDNNYVWVGDCLAHGDEAVYCYTSEEYIWADDSFCCEDCNETHHQNYVRSIEYGDRDICESCLEYGDYVYCEDSGYYHHIDNVYYSENDDCYYADADNADNGLVCSYSTNILDKHGRNCYVNGKIVYQFRDRRIYGVELEVDSRGHCAETIAQAVIDKTRFEQYGIFKHDGSINGVELVTLPADVYSHKHHFDWQNVCDTLRPIARGHYGHNNGMHVHINRGAVSALTLGKMLVFMNSPSNYSLLSTIAQRDIQECGWCKVDGALYAKVGDCGKSPAKSGKYSILNVTRNTIEVRMFNASLLPERIYKNVEFCDALVMFARDTSAKELNDSQFIQFVAANKKEYKNLHEFIQSRYVEDNMLQEVA